VCGINGIFDLGRIDEGSRLPRSEIDAMNAAIAHRGPDGGGVYVQPGLALGHRRLAILDLSDAGSQPMFSADGSLVLVFNGEIYNYLELIPELAARGHVMRSRSDSEVILHAYAAWGDACVQRFNGMWSFAIWDRRKRRLFASRDRMGVKPFVYSQRDGRLWFSSEVAGLRAVLPLHQANLGKVHDFLAYGYRTNDGETFFEGVNELMPGHNLVLENEQLAVRRYWQLPALGAGVPAVKPLEEFRALITDAVRIRLRSDVPVALLQSGGLDSSVICAIVNREFDEGRLGKEKVTAFTAVHPGHAYDESGLVRELMRRTPHIESKELIPPGESLAEQLPSYVAALQEPQASSTSYAHWCLMQAVRQQGVKVVINGQGADEAFAGYGAYIRGYRMLDVLLSQPSRAWSEAAGMRHNMNLGWGSLVAQTGKAMLGRRAASSWRGWFKEGGARVLSPALRRQHQTRLPEVPMTFKADNLDRNLRSQLLDYGFNQILNYEDYSAMSQGIEIRSPFIDYRLMEFAFALPDEQKFSNGITKKVIRNAFRSELPTSIVDARTKIGFATPFDRWSATPQFRAFVSELTASADFQQRSLWRAPQLAATLNDNKAWSRGFPVWRYIVTALWLKQQGINNV
jgi:asparagine synthase (glutamine-hydrolysing)